jgi:hypothetical protein
MKKEKPMAKTWTLIVVIKWDKEGITSQTLEGYLDEESAIYAGVKIRDDLRRIDEIGKFIEVAITAVPYPECQESDL